MMSARNIPEKDKPFILAFIGSAITVLNIAIIGIGAWYEKPEMVKSGMESLKFTFTLTAMAWAFYFKTGK